MRFLDAGETHGYGLVGILEGFPANVRINIDNINKLLKLRQKGYGRGGRMKIESDQVKFLSGVRNGKTLGSPISIFIENKDYKNWEEYMSPDRCDIETKKVTIPRPGHADLPGIIKYDTNDARNILERASARETAMRVAIGALCEELLKYFNIKLYNHVVEIGNIKSNYNIDDVINNYTKIENSELFCADPISELKMKETIDIAKENGDSLGGIAEVICENVPIGLGSHTHWDRRLDAQIAYSVMGIQSVKGVEIGLGFEYSKRTGSKCHDEIFFDNQKGFYRKTNNAGGIEGGISNGEKIVVRAVFKPIPTLYKPLKSVDIVTKQEVLSSIERSDICAVPAGSVVMRSAIAFVLANALTERLSSDTIEDMLESIKII
ncbi:chorismate synthase [Caldicellulosiruptoraceae bacterium PP1]